MSRLFRIAEIEIVGNRAGQGARGGQIAPSLGDRLFRPLVRVGLAIALRHIGGERQAFWPVADTNDRRVAARRLHRIAKDQMVVLLENPAFGTNIRGG